MHTGPVLSSSLSFGYPDTAQLGTVYSLCIAQDLFSLVKSIFGRHQIYRKLSTQDWHFLDFTAFCSAFVVGSSLLIFSAAHHG